MGKVKRMLVTSLVVLYIFTVTGCAAKVKSIDLGMDELEISEGESYSLTPKIEPDNISIDDAKLTWETSDANVATVINGEIKGKKAGTANISVTSENGVIASCYVTVVKLSAYDKLSDNDKYFFDHFIEHICSVLKNPSSASIVEVRDLSPYVGDDILISAMNGFGGYGQMIIWNGGGGAFYDYDYDTHKHDYYSHDISDAYDISGLNAAIKEYFGSNP